MTENQSEPTMFTTGFTSEEDGTAVILRYEGPAHYPHIHGVYLRRPGDDESFYRLRYSGSYIRGLRPCRDVRSDEEFEFVYKFEENTLVWCGQSFVKDNSILEDAELVPFPDTRRIEYFCGNDDTMILVTVPEHAYSYEAFHFYVGNSDGSDMRLVPHFGVSRLRDGGTTSISTAEGGFHSPSWLKGENPRWSGREMKRLDPNGFVIDETSDGVTITRK